jgi:hypothetical protein
LTEYRAVFDRSQFRWRAEEVGAELVMSMAADRAQAECSS